MRHSFRLSHLFLTALLLLLTLLAATACGAPSAENGGSQPPIESGAARSPTESGNVQAPEPVPTLKELYGEDYAADITETIVMQMGNRMDKAPDVDYYPISENAPLSDFAAIDENTAFQVNPNGSVTILFSAGSVTDEVHGEQSFTIPKP